MNQEDNLTYAQEQENEDGMREMSLKIIQEVKHSASGHEQKQESEDGEESEKLNTKNCHLGNVDNTPNGNDVEEEGESPRKEINGNEMQGLSKRQRKKLLKRQKWLDTRADRRKHEREKLRQRTEAKRAAGEACVRNPRKQLKRTTMAGSTCRMRVAVDMSFDDLMIEKHLCQCVKQLSRCYSANRRTKDPIQLYFTSFTGKCVDIMARQNGYQHWDVHFKPEHFTQLFSKKQIVYLTSESENVITELDKDSVYIIGGLVDHNAHKGLCLSLAQEKGLRHARLPIDEFVNMKTRKVLTIDHVFRIMAGVAHGQSWRDAFLDIIPARKGAVGKDEEEEEAEEKDEAKTEEKVEENETEVNEKKAKMEKNAEEEDEERSAREIKACGEREKRKVDEEVGKGENDVKKIKVDSEKTGERGNGENINKCKNNDTTARVTNTKVNADTEDAKEKNL